MSARDGLILKFSTDLLPAQKSIQDFCLNSVSMLSSLGRKAAESQTVIDTLGKGAQRLALLGTAFAGFEAIKFSLEEVTKAAAAAEAELGKLVKVGDDAKSVGVGTTFFQQFTEGSKKLGLEADDLTKILDNLKNASMVSLGTGDDKDPQSTAQKAIGAEISAGNLNKGDDQAFNAAGSQEERLRAALNLIAELQQKGAQLAAFDLGGKLFGADFETKLRGDSDLVANLQQRLTDMANGKGVNVVPPEQIEAAREMQAQIEDMNERIQNALIPFHNDLRAWQQSELQSTIELKEYWVEIVEVFGQLWKYAERIGHTISGWGANGVMKDLTGLLDRMGMLKEGDGFHSFRDKDGNLTTLSQARKDGTEPAAPDSRPPLTITKPKGDTSKPLPEEAKPAHANHEETDPIEDYINSLKKESAAEQAKASTLGLSNQAQREALDLAKAREIAAEHDRTLTAAETAEIKAQADAYAAAETKINQFAKSQEQAKAQAQYLGQEVEGSIEKMALGGGKLRDVMLDVVKSLEQAALKAAILGEGPLAGLFGTGSGGINGEGKGFGGLGGLLGMATHSFAGVSTASGDAAADAAQDAADYGVTAGGASIFGGIGKLFAGFFADGGNIPAGGWGVAGESGAEIINGPATVTPVGAINKAMAGLGASNVGSVTHAPTYILPQPAAGVTAEQMTAAIAAYDKQSQRTLLANIHKAQTRF